MTSEASLNLGQPQMEWVKTKIFVVKGLNSLPNDKYLDWSKLKVFADNKINMTENLKFVLRKGEYIVGKGEKCWLPVCSPFSLMFSKAFLFKIIKAWDCVLKVYFVVCTCFSFGQV